MTSTELGMGIQTNSISMVQMIKIYTGNKKTEEKPGPLKYYSHFYFNRLGAYRIKENPVQEKKMTEKTSLMEEAGYIARKGHVLIVTPKEHGEDTLIWKNNQVLEVICRERHRLDVKAVI